MAFKSEIGRSMVEILGVLSIVGLLSIGALNIYKYAIDKYKANEIAQEARLRASDIFHRYQVQAFPDVGAFNGYENCTNDFEEWPSETKSGYTVNTCAIKDEDGTDLAFAIAVKDVHRGVCQRLVDMNPHEYLEGFHYMIIDGEQYVDGYDPCNADVQDVVFVMLLNDAECDGDDCGKACVLRSDCDSVCDCAVCDRDTYTCVLPLSPAGEPQVCNEGICEPTQQCLEGEGFRIASGVCVPCEDDSDYVIDPGEEPFKIAKDGVTLVEDAVSPSDLCTACGNGRQWLDSRSGNRRCFVTCPLDVGYTPVLGYSGNQYDNDEYKKRCIPCDSKQDYGIVGSDAAVACKACGNYVYDRATWTSNFNVKICGPICAPGEFKGTIHPNGGGHCGGDCYACDSTETPLLFSDGTSANGKIDHEKLCTDCGRDVIVRGGHKYCMDMDMCSDEEFITGPYLASEGNNVWVGGKCIKCSDKNSYMIWNSSDATTDTYTKFDEACKACGNREVVVDKDEDRWCVFKTETTCGQDEFLDSNGTCHKCSEQGAVTIVSNEHSQCESVCNGESIDTDKDGIADTLKQKRRAIGPSLGEWRCVPVCPEGQIQATDGKCYDCDTDTSFYIGLFDTLNTECVSCTMKVTSEDGTVTEKQMRSRTNPGRNCKKILDCPSGQFLGADGKCHLCSETEQVRSSESQCLKCSGKNGSSIRTYYEGDHYCWLVDAGKSGSCNSLGDTQGENPYKAGDGVYFRGSLDGKCYRCDTKDDVYVISHTDQCTSCGNMRILNGGITCSLKQACSEGASFWSEEKKQCVLCNSVATDQNLRYLTTYGKRGLCAGCGLRFMQVDVYNDETEEQETAYYCSKTCGIGQWQDTDGNCIDCDKNSLLFANYIGSDSESIELCKSCHQRTISYDDNGLLLCEMYAE